MCLQEKGKRCKEKKVAPLPLWPFRSAINFFRQVRRPRFSSALFKILRGIHPNLQISQKGMQVVSDICVDILERMAAEANHFRRISRMETLRVDHFISGVKTLFTTDGLRNHALCFAARSTMRFADAQWKHRYVPPDDRPSLTPEPAEAPGAGGTASASP